MINWSIGGFVAFIVIASCDRFNDEFVQLLVLVVEAGPAMVGGGQDQQQGSGANSHADKHAFPPGCQD